VESRIDISTPGRRNGLHVTLSERQRQAWAALDDPSVDQVLYGGAKGGGKSFLLCWWAFATACRIAHEYGLADDPPAHPISVGWIGRKRAVHFKQTTLQTWLAAIPAAAYQLQKGDQRIIIGPVAIDYGGLDTSEALHKFNSAEYGFVCVDQAEETTEDDVNVLLASRRLRIRGRHVPAKALFTANPAQCWLKRDFVDAPAPNRRFVPALPADNPFLPADYVSILQDAFRHRPELAAAYIRGDWSAIDSPAQVIRHAWLVAATQREIWSPHKRRYMVCDPARFGDDETVIYYCEDGDPVKQWIYPHNDAIQLENILHRLAIEQDVAAVAIDTTEGMGAAVADHLQVASAGNYDVIYVNNASRSSQPDRYVNLRAEQWDTAARLLSAGEVILSNEDQKLWDQLTAVQFEFVGPRLKIEPKDQLKERLGCSPDRADAYVMNLWLMQQIVPESHRTQHRNDGRGYLRPRYASAMSA